MASDFDPRTARGDTAWFTRDRFGMFIHWGLYALGARHEWLQHNEKIPADEYAARYFNRFDPDLFDPEAWAAAADDAGMKYFVITSKHHEGFCLWDSALTDFKATNTPAKRDLLRPVLDAFRARGLRAGLYHSLIDWHHPDFIQDPHIGPNRESKELAALNAGRDQQRYARYLHGQVDELLSNYGPIDILWFDFSYPHADGSGKSRADWNSEALVADIRRKAPGIILNDRLDLPYGWDIKTPEQGQPRRGLTVDGKPVVWEACQTLSGSWGYHRDEMTWRSTPQLIRTLVDCVAKDGNLLLNVGPTGRGEFDDRALERLRGLGAWMRRHGRSIYGCGPAPAAFTVPEDARLTYNAEKNRLYVHLFAWPYKMLHLDGAFRERVEYAQFLHDASEVHIATAANTWNLAHVVNADDPTLTLNLPQVEPPVDVPVIELFLKAD